MSDTLLLRGGGIVIHYEIQRGGIILPIQGQDGSPPCIQVPIVLLDKKSGQPRDRVEAITEAANKAITEILRMEKELEDKDKPELEVLTGGRNDKHVPIPSSPELIKKH